MSPLWLGVDVGTSAVKALAVDGTGIVRGRARVEYATRPGREQDALAYVAAAERAIAACGARDTDVDGVGVCGQTPTLVLVDAAGEPVRPALTWSDDRAAREAAELAAEYGAADELVGLDLPWTPAFPPAKLLWLARHEPRAIARTRVLLQPKDVVGLALTGRAVSDPWSSKGLVHLRALGPATELLERCGWRADHAPSVAPGWTPAGEVTADAAARFCLPVGTPVAVGLSDAMAGMLALGAFDAPIAFLHAGTSSIIGCSTDADPPACGVLLAIPRTCAPRPILYGPTQSSGASVGWLANVLTCAEEDVLALAEWAKPETTALFVPYLAGERAPIWRSDVRGMFVGLSSRDGSAELARAVLDGVCFAESHVLLTAEKQLGTHFAEVRVAGRGTSAAAWLEARLRALGRRLLVLAERDVSALGAAMLGAAAANGGDLSAAAGLRSSFDSVEPDERMRDEAEMLRSRYIAASGTAIAWTEHQTAEHQSRGR